MEGILEFNDLDVDEEEVSISFVAGEHLTLLKFPVDEKITIKETRRNDVYHFELSNMSIVVDSQSSSIEFRTKFLVTEQMYDVDGDTRQKLKAAMKAFIKERKNSHTRQKGREVASTEELGASRRLPENIDSVIGSFLSGKKGSSKAQKEKLMQNLGVHLAPRPGGGGSTRRRRSYS